MSAPVQIELLPASALVRRERVSRIQPVLAHLPSYDVIAVSTSAGKDSLAALSYVVELAEAMGVKSRVVAVHANLGWVEWRGTSALARRQAEALGVPYLEVSRIGGTAKKDGKLYAAGETHGDLLDYARRRGAWPSATNRWCTSDFKRGPISRVHTQLAKEWRQAGGTGPCRILDVMGMRAEESPRRAKLDQMSARKRTSNQHVDTWLPIQHWTEAEVWYRIRSRCLEYHWAYDLGMPRLSCVFCIFAPRAALVLAGTHNRDLLEEYVAVERETGHTFKADLSLAEILDAVDAGAGVEEMDGAWDM